MITSQLMCVQEEEPDTPPAPSTMMLLSDHSGQPTKSRNLAEKMEATRMQLKTLVYEALANHAYLSLHSDAQRALPTAVSLDMARDLESRQKGTLIQSQLAPTCFVCSRSPFDRGVTC